MYYLTRKYKGLKGGQSYTMGFLRKALTDREIYFLFVSRNLKSNRQRFISYIVKQVNNAKLIISKIKSN